MIFEIFSLIFIIQTIFISDAIIDIYYNNETIDN